MQIIGPLQLSIITKNYSWQKKNHLAVTSLLGFPLSGGRPLLESELWSRLGDVLGSNILDMGMPKPNGEVLLFANYHSPNGKPVTAGRARLQCGSVNKELAVIGNRYWRAMIGPTAPEPFTSMPLSWEHAYGGAKYDKNTLGKGMEPVDVHGEQRVPLPNIEYPDKLMTSESDRPEPAGFGALDIMWQQRLKRAGTYDKKWVQEYAPAYPLDIDWNYFNSAAEDQWLEHFWRGDESFSLHHMHPDIEVIQGQLPNFRGRAFIVPKNNEGAQLSEIKQRLETVFLFPEIDTGVLLWRGVIDVVEDDLTDMQAMLCAFEHADAPPHPLAHYQQAYDNRQDPQLQLKYLNNTEDLIPQRVPCGYRYVTLSEDDVSMPLLENCFAGAEQSKNEMIAQANEKKAELKHQLEGMKDNMSPEVYAAKMAELDKEIDFPQFKVPDKQERLDMLKQELLTEPVDFSKLEDEIKGQVQDGKNQAKQKLIELAEQMKTQGVEEEKLAAIDEALKNIDRPPLLPRPFVDEIRSQMEQQLVDIEQQKQQLISTGRDVSNYPELEIDLDQLFEKFKQLEAMQKDGYRLSAHNGEPGRHHHAESLVSVAQRLLAAFQNGESLKDQDLACIDLSNQDLTGIDLEGAYLEQVNLSGAVLNKANLKGAILANANLTGAHLFETNLEQANLGKVDFRRASLNACNLQQSILEESRFDEASITNCDLAQTVTTGASFKGVNFSGSMLLGFNAEALDLSDCRFNSCQLSDASFTKCRLEQASFRQAILEKATFSECQGNRVDFSTANLHNARFHEECIMPNANFSQAQLERAVFQYASLEEACFDEVQCYMADFSQSNLQRASFHRAIGKKAQFVRSDLGYARMTSMNLMEGSLMKARLTGTDFSDSNLYAVEFINATVGGTNFSAANLDMSKLQEWRP